VFGYFGSKLNFMVKKESGYMSEVLGEKSNKKPYSGSCKGV
jgi:hypothetical protein